MKKIFNKLVRDKIPQIIQENGDIPNTSILTDEENLIELNKKLQEEVNEYLSAETLENSVEELADIVEVIYGILYAKKIKIENFEEIRLKKEEKRGGFKQKIFLNYTLKE